MNEALLSPKNIIVQGITGSHGSFHTNAMVGAGTNIIAGTSPSKSGQFVNNIPVYESIAAIQHSGHAVDASVIFVPARHAKGAVVEAVEAGVPLIVCITEGIPVHDMLYIKQRLKNSKSILIGPNCPGILIPGKTKLGIIPANLALPGNVGIVSRSGTLTYEAVAELTRRGMGQKYIIGIGGDPIQGTGFTDCLELFQNDPDVHSIVMIGEIGGTSEYTAADFISSYVTKPVYTYITGHHAPAGVQLGHAGAIMGSARESAASKTAYLAEKGVVTATNLSALIEKIAVSS